MQWTADKVQEEIVQLLQPFNPKGIEITHFDVPDVRFSDHRPLICDFEVRPQ